MNPIFCNTIDIPALLLSSKSTSSDKAGIKVFRSHSDINCGTTLSLLWMEQIHHMKSVLYVMDRIIPSCI